MRHVRLQHASIAASSCSAMSLRSPTTSSALAAHSSSSAPAVRTDSPISIVSPAGEAERLVPGRARGLPQLLGGPRTAHARGQPLVHLDGAGLGEHVDHGIAVRAQCQPRPGFAERHARPDAVGELGLGRRAEAHVRPCVAQRRDVVRRQVRGMDGRRARGPGAGLRQQRDRGQAGGGDALLVLGRLLRDVDVQRRVRQRGGDRGQLVAGHRAYGVDRGADHDVVLAGVLLRQLARPARPTPRHRRR